MKTTVIVLGVLLLAVVGVTGKALATPTDRTVEKTQTLVKFEQQGKFDYQVTALPSYLQDGETDAGTETTPIPLSYIESFIMTYSFTSESEAGSSMSVDAVLENTGTWQKAVNLASRSGTGSLSFPVDLAYLQETADAINKEIGVSSGNQVLTIRATVGNGIASNGTTADFVQELPLELSRAVLKMGENLEMSRGEATGVFGYQIQLGENLLYGPVLITPPGQQSRPAVTLGPEDTVFLKLVQGMEMAYSYHITAEPRLQQMQSEVTIQTIAANPKVWAKTYDLVPAIRYDGDVKVSFPLDFDQFSEIFDNVQKETGVSASEQSLTIAATVHTTGQTERGRLDETFTQSITTNLRAGVLSWEGELNKTTPGVVESRQTTVEAGRLWGRPVIEIRIIGALIVMALLVLLGIFLWTNRKRQETEAQLLMRKSAEIERKYKTMLVEIKDRPESRLGDIILAVDSVEELVKVSQGLLKPINHALDENIHVYWVYDDHKRYEYQLINPKLEIPADEDIPIENPDTYRRAGHQNQDRDTIRLNRP